MKRSELKQLIREVINEEEEDLKNIFKGMFPITKDLQPLRVKKGPFLEDIAELLQNKYKFTNYKSAKTGFGYAIFNEDIDVNEDESIGLYSFYGRIGIPTFIVGVQNISKWNEIKEYLRSEGVIR